MYKPKKKFNRNRIIGILAVIPSVLLLITFFHLASTNASLTDNEYAAIVFTFIFGLLGLITSIGSFFIKS